MAHRAQQLQANTIGWCSRHHRVCAPGDEDGAPAPPASRCAALARRLDTLQVQHVKAFLDAFKKKRLCCANGWDKRRAVESQCCSAGRCCARRGPHFAGLRVKAGLSDVRLHDLRHTVVSVLMDLGVPPHVVQAIVRHSDVKITLQIYAHTNLAAMREALGRLDGWLS